MAEKQVLIDDVVNAVRSRLLTVMFMVITLGSAAAAYAVFAHRELTKQVKEASWSAQDKGSVLPEVLRLRDTQVAIILVATMGSAALLIYASRSLELRTRRAAELMRQADTLIEQTAQDLRSSSAQLLAAARQTEANARDEAAAVEETRHTMRALLEAAEEIARGSQTLLDNAERATRAATLIAERSNQLNAQALNISDIARMIRTIADRSDLLALNASLEGVKAGEAGHGFLIVGLEMRRLAEMVVGAVRQIEQLADGIRRLSQSAILATEEGQKASLQASETSKRISMTTGQQRSGTEQVSQSMNEIQTYTQQALSSAKQATTTANDLVRTADELARLLEEATAVEPQSPASAPPQ